MKTNKSQTLQFVTFFLMCLVCYENFSGSKKQQHLGNMLAMPRDIITHISSYSRIPEIHDVPCVFYFYCKLFSILKCMSGTEDMMLNATHRDILLKNSRAVYETSPVVSICWKYLLHRQRCIQYQCLVPEQRKRRINRVSSRSRNIVLNSGRAIFMRRDV